MGTQLLLAEVVYMVQYSSKHLLKIILIPLRVLHMGMPQKIRHLAGDDNLTI